MTVARAEFFDGYRLRRVGIRIEEQGVVRARRLLLIRLLQQGTMPWGFAVQQAQWSAGLLKQPDKQKSTRIT